MTLLFNPGLANIDEGGHLILESARASPSGGLINRGLIIEGRNDRSLTAVSVLVVSGLVGECAPDAVVEATTDACLASEG